MSRAPVPRRPMTPDEIRMGEALGLCRFVPASFDKRFVGEMAACARDEAPAITEKQATLLRRMVHRYRRQLPREILALAGECPPPMWETPPAAPTPAAAVPPSPAARPVRRVPSDQLPLL